MYELIFNSEISYHKINKNVHDSNEFYFHQCTLNEHKMLLHLQCNGKSLYFHINSCIAVSSFNDYFYHNQPSNTMHQDMEKIVQLKKLHMSAIYRRIYLKFYSTLFPGCVLLTTDILYQNI